MYEYMNMSKRRFNLRVVQRTRYDTIWDKILQYKTHLPQVLHSLAESRLRVSLVLGQQSIQLFLRANLSLPY